RYATAREQAQESGVDRALNHTVAQSILVGLMYDENEAKSHLVGRWFRELTPGQARALDKTRLGQAGAKKLGMVMAPNTSAEQVGAEKEQNELEDPLSPLQYDILDALRALNAIDSEKRKTNSKIAEKVGGTATEQSCKAPLADLKHRGLVASQTGR